MENQIRFKFRAWDIKEQIMLDSQDLMFEGLSLSLNGLGIISTKWEETGIRQNKYDALIILMQFTGMTDSSGKEIYEGDIVGCYDQEEKYCKSKIEWDSSMGSWMQVNLIDGSGYNITSDDAKGQKVIGNIYEQDNAT